MTSRIDPTTVAIAVAATSNPACDEFPMVEKTEPAPARSRNAGYLDEKIPSESDAQDNVPILKKVTRNDLEPKSKTIAFPGMTKPVRTIRLTTLAGP